MREGEKKTEACANILLPSDGHAVRMLKELAVFNLLSIEAKDAPDSVTDECEHDEDQLQAGKNEEISVEAPLTVGGTLETANRSEMMWMHTHVEGQVLGCRGKQVDVASVDERGDSCRAEMQTHEQRLCRLRSGEEGEFVAGHRSE